MFTEDLDVFFSGLDATTATLAGSPLRGYVQSGFDVELLDGLVPPAGSEPRFVCKTASVPAVALGRAFVVPSGPAAGTYAVSDVRHSGTGISEILLKAQI